MATSQNWSDFASDARNEPGWIEVRNWETGENLFDPIKTASEPLDICFSPTQDLFVATCGNGEGLIVDSRDGSMLRKFEVSSENKFSVNANQRICFHPDGKRFVAYASERDNACLFDVERGKLLEYPVVNAISAQFSHDASKIAFSTQSNTAIVCDFESGKVLHELEHSNWVFRTQFSPDDRSVATASRDKMVRVWDLHSEKIEIAIPHDEEVLDLIWHPQKPYLVTAGRDGKVRMFSATSGRLMTPPIISSDTSAFCWQVSFCLDDNAIVSTGSANKIALFNLSEIEGRTAIFQDSKDLVAFAELLSGYEVIDSSTARLTTAGWYEKWMTRRLGHSMSIPDVQQDAVGVLRARLKIEFIGEHWTSVNLLSDRILQEAPTDSDVLCKKGIALYYLGRLDESLEAVEACLKIDPKSQEAIHYRAHVYARRNDPRALEDLDRLIALQPTRYHFYVMRFDYLLSTRQYQEAVSALKESEKAGEMTSKAASDYLMSIVKLIPSILAENELEQASAISEILGWLDMAAHTEPMNDNSHYNHACIKSLQAEILAARRKSDPEKVTEESVRACEAESLKHLKIYFSEFNGDREVADQDRDLQHVRALPDYEEFRKDD